MIKYKIDNVSAEANRTVVYVNMFDDKAPDTILSRLCVPFESQESFERALAQKAKKHLDRTAGKDEIKGLAEESIGKVESNLAAFLVEEKPEEPVNINPFAEVIK